MPCTLSLQLFPIRCSKVSSSASLFDVLVGMCNVSFCNKVDTTAGVEDPFSNLVEHPSSIAARFVDRTCPCFAGVLMLNWLIRGWIPTMAFFFGWIPDPWSCLSRIGLWRRNGCPRVLCFGTDRSLLFARVPVTKSILIRLHVSESQAFLHPADVCRCDMCASCTAYCGTDQPQGR